MPSIYEYVRRKEKHSSAVSVRDTKGCMQKAVSGALRKQKTAAEHMLRTGGRSYVFDDAGDPEIVRRR